MKRFFTYLICSLTFTMMIARSEASGKFDIYLCIGQSNMAGDFNTGCYGYFSECLSF